MRSFFFFCSLSIDLSTSLPSEPFRACLFPSSLPPLHEWHHVAGCSHSDKLTMHACMYTYMHAYMHAYIHTYIIHTYIHTYMHACMHACIHAYIHWTTPCAFTPTHHASTPPQKNNPLAPSRNAPAPPSGGFKCPWKKKEGQEEGNGKAGGGGVKNIINRLGGGAGAAAADGAGEDEVVVCCQRTRACARVLARCCALLPFLGFVCLR